MNRIGMIGAGAISQRHLNAPEAAQCEEAAKRSDKVLMYGFVIRFYKEAVFRKDYISSGAMGKIYYAEVARMTRAHRIGGWFLNKELSGGGQIIDAIYASAESGREILL